MKKIISMVMALSLVLTGCGTTKPLNTTAEGKTSNITVQELKQKYGVEKNTELMPMYNVENNKEFDFKFKSNLRDISNYDIISVHTDAKCLDASQILTINSLDFSKLSNDETDIKVIPNCDVLASDKTLNNGGGVWGNAPIYYIRINYDMESTTPKKLDNPIIIPFTVKSDLPVPNLKKEISSDGKFKLVWDKVEGAEKYKVYNISRIDLGKITNRPTSSAEDGYMQIPQVVTTTTKTELDEFSRWPDIKSNSGTVTIENGSVSGDYYVTAVSGDKESNFSVPVSTPALSSQIPYKADNKTDIFLKDFNDVSQLPKSIGVMFIDGSIQDREVIYDTSNIKLNEYGYTGIDYTIKGTALKGYLNVKKFKEEDIKALKPIENANSSTGTIEAENNTDDVPSPDVPTIIKDKNASSKENTKKKETPTKDTKDADVKENDNSEDNIVEQQKQNTQEQVTEGDKEKIATSDILDDIKLNASSALEEYLATEMISAKKDISLKAFPEAQNSKTIDDVLRKVVYQNPLIIGVKGFEYDYSTLTLTITYNDEPDVIAKKQQEIFAEAKKIVSSEINAGMSNEKKRKTLYDYLDKNTKYDDDALKDAEASNYKKVDAKFNDSFTTYGIMVKKVGVCASYAYSYKLLCDIAGIECIVVTGSMDTVPHAWNKVKIDNEWLTTDCTNNATNSGIPYMMYEGNDKLLKELNYTESDEFWIDNEIVKFAGKTDKYDYYVANGLVINDVSNYKSKLSELLKNGQEKILFRLGTATDKKSIETATAEVFNDVAKDKLDTAGFAVSGKFVLVVTDKNKI